MPTPKPFVRRLVMLTIATALLSSAVAAQNVASCQIARTDGSVTVERDGVPQAAFTGLALDRGDLIETEAASGATLVCSDGLRIIVGAEARIGLDRLMSAEDRGGWPGVDLFQGLMGVLRPGGQRGGFAIRTPSAVAAVRSTEWSMEVTGAATSAFVREGRVSIFASNRTAELDAGEGVDVDADGIAGETKDWGAARVDGVAERLGPDW